MEGWGRGGDIYEDQWRRRARRNMYVMLRGWSYLFIKKLRLWTKRWKTRVLTIPT